MVRRIGGGGGGGGATKWWWWVLVFLAVVSALCVSGPALYSKLKQHSSNSPSNIKSFVHYNNNNNKAAVGCAPCTCNCPPPLSLLTVAPGLANLSVADCGGDDPELREEMGKQYVDLLSEEMKLQETVGAEHAHHVNITFGEAKRVATQYQREADKCIAATETCEQARERSQALLTKEKKVTSLWEQRARKLGWEG